MTYQLKTLLGSGGFADVWRAYDTSRQMTVAIKLLRNDDASSRARFIAEARLLAACSHSHLMPILHADMTVAQPYIVMPYCAGGSLARLAGRVNAGNGCALMVDTCSALRYLHSRGVFHRDVKLQNVLLDSSGRAILSDLGIAHVPEEPPRTTRAIGTPGHIAPEAVNDPTHPTAAMDVYGVGASLFHLVTGVHPSRRGTLDVGPGGSNRRRALRKLIVSCTHPDPNRRPRLRDVEARLRLLARNGTAATPAPTSDARGQGPPIGAFVLAAAAVLLLAVTPS